MLTQSVAMMNMEERMIAGMWSQGSSWERLWFDCEYLENLKVSKVFHIGK